MPVIVDTPERILRKKIADILREKGVWSSAAVPSIEQIINILRSKLINKWDLHNGEPGPNTLVGDDIPF